MAPKREQAQSTPKKRPGDDVLIFKFVEKREEYQNLWTRLDAMSAALTEGAFLGIRTNISTNDRSSTSSPAPPPHGGKVPISRSAKRSASLHKAARSTTPSAGPQGILKRSKISPTKKHVHIKSDPDVRTYAPSNDISLFADQPKTPTTATMSASQENRPKLKLKLSNFPSAQPPAPAAQVPSTPASVATPSIKLKLKQPGAPTPTSASVATPASNPKKIKKEKAPGSSAKKRKQREEDGGDSSADELAPRPQKSKKIRFVQKPEPATPIIKLKTKGKAPKRPLGVGYDSELSEREEDPTISEAFMFRMTPGPDCDYLRNAIENNLIGIPPRDGGADIRLQFWDRHGRRAMVTIRGRRYAATMVDLPCVIEGMKSWDKKGWIKSADISQMLLVLGRVETDEQAQNYELPIEVDPQTFQYAHGVTPPMQWVRKRRFARTKRTSLSAIEAVERKVNQLLADDGNSESVKWDIIDYDTWAREEYDREHSQANDYDEEEDAEGEEDDDDYFGREEQLMNGGVEDEDMDDEDDLAAELEMHLADAEADEDEEMATAAPDGAIPRPNLNGLAPDGNSFAMTSTSPSASAPTAAGTAAATPAAAETSADEEEEEEASGAESSDLDADDVDVSDEEAAAAIREQREKIAELEDSIKAEEEKFKGMANPILKKKIMSQIQKLRADLEMARRGVGGDGDDEE